MTTTSPNVRGGLSWQLWALAIALLLAVDTDLASAATKKVAERPSAVASWLRSTAIFLVIAGAGAYVWYFGLFPWLLRKKNPSWPLDAWRTASYGAWLTACVATLVFRGPLMALLTPFLLGTVLAGFSGPVRNTLLTSFMELVLIPLVALVGLVLIWNFRRDVANRARPV